MPPGCWDRVFESSRGHGYSSCVFVVCCVGSGFCYELITCSEQSYRMCVCVCVYVCVYACVCICVCVCV